MSEICIARWCAECGIDLFLSDEPTVIDDDVALCDFCGERDDGKTEYVSPKEVRERIEDIESEIDGLQDEIDNLEGEIDELTSELIDLRNQLKRG